MSHLFRLCRDENPTSGRPPLIVIVIGSEEDSQTTHGHGLRDVSKIGVFSSMRIVVWVKSRVFRLRPFLPQRTGLVVSRVGLLGLEAAGAKN